MNRKLLTIKKCKEICKISRISLINYEKRLITPVESGKSKTATQQLLNQRKQQMRDLLTGKHKRWQALSMILDFCCLERSYRDLSPLKRAIISKDWIVVANRLAPACLAAGTMTLPKYRLLGLEVSEMAEYKYPNPSCAN